MPPYSLGHVGTARPEPASAWRYARPFSRSSFPAPSTDAGASARRGANRDPSSARTHSRKSFSSMGQLLAQRTLLHLATRGPREHISQFEPLRHLVPGQPKREEITTKI